MEAARSLKKTSRKVVCTIPLCARGVYVSHGPLQRIGSGRLSTSLKMKCVSNAILSIDGNGHGFIVEFLTLCLELPLSCVLRGFLFVLFQKIRRPLAQGVSDHTLLDFTRSNILFFTGLIPKCTIRKAKINIERQLLQLLLLLLLLLLKLMFLVHKLGA